jgi:hypothetical protein
MRLRRAGKSDWGLSGGASRAPGDAGLPPDFPSWDDKGWPAGLLVPRRRVRWPLFIRARVRLRRFALDKQLARGADPRSSAELARRAKELCEPKLRRRLSSDIERAIEDASAGPRYLTASIPLNRGSVRLCQDSLLGLAQDLRSPGPVYASGVALVRLMLLDGASPLYMPSDERELLEEVHRAHAALNGLAEP